MFRSNKHIYGQLIDDSKNITILSSSSKDNDFNSKGGSFVLKPKSLRADNPTVVINLDAQTANDLIESGNNLNSTPFNTG